MSILWRPVTAALVLIGGLGCLIKQHKFALSCSEIIIRLETKYSKGYFLKAETLRHLEEYPKAIEFFTIGLKYEPRAYKWYYFRGWCFCALKDHSWAIADFNLMLSHKPQYNNGFLLRAESFLNLKNYSLAIDDYTTYLTSNPNNLTVWNHLGHSYLKLRQYIQAFNTFNHAVEIDASHPMSYLNRGWLYLYFDQIESAIADFKICTELATQNFATNTSQNSSMPITLAGLIQLWLELEKITDFKSSTVSALLITLRQLAENYSASYLALVCDIIGFAIQQMWEASLIKANEALSKYPDEELFFAYFWKSLALAQLGNEAEAVENLQKALSEDIPKVLLFPLHWLKISRPKFYEQNILTIPNLFITR